MKKFVLILFNLGMIFTMFLLIAHDYDTDSFNINFGTFFKALNNLEFQNVYDIVLETYDNIGNALNSLKQNYGSFTFDSSNMFAFFASVGNFFSLIWNTITSFWQVIYYSFKGVGTSIYAILYNYIVFMKWLFSFGQ